MLHAPTLLVDSARKVRHRTEHEYTIPAVIDVLTAVEAAQFFYLFVEAKTSSVGQVDITDIKLILDASADKEAYLLPVADFNMELAPGQSSVTTTAEFDPSKCFESDFETHMRKMTGIKF